MSLRALRHKQPFGLRPGGKDAADVQAGCTQQATQGGGAEWSIKALLPSPRQLPGASVISGMLRRARRCRQGPAAPTELQAPTAPAEPAGTLATALSIQPLPEGQLVTAGDSLDAMLAAQPAALPLPGRRSRLRLHRRALHSSSGAAGSRAGSDALEAVLAELGAVQRHAAEQAALLASCRACAADMRQQVAAVQGQLSECEAEIAAVERQAAAAEAAAAEAPGARPTAQQAAALQRELLHLAQSTAAEQRRLEAAASEAGQRTAGLRAAAHERHEAAATWRRRVELMASSHVPLSPAQERRRCESRQRFWGRGV